MSTTPEDISARLARATVASCSCMTKTPDTHYHAVNCSYRLFSDALTEINLLRAGMKVLARRADAAEAAGEWQRGSRDQQITELETALANARADRARLDYLEWRVANGGCPGLINDDAGRWAVSETGVQNVPDSDAPSDISTSFFVEAKDWRESARAAIDDAMAKEGKE